MCLSIFCLIQKVLIVSHVWMLKAFESQSRGCLFEYRQIKGHFCIHKRMEGVASALRAF